MKGNLFTNNDLSTDIKTKIDNINTSINGLEPYLETYTPDATQGFFIYIILILLLLALVILLMLLTNI